MEVVAEDSYLPSLKEFGQMALTFGLTVIAWIFFRADNIVHAIEYLTEIFSSSLYKLPEVIPKPVLLLIFVFVIIEWIGREGQFAIEFIKKFNPSLIRWAIYFVIIIAILLFGNFSENQFIYFQF